MKRLLNMAPSLSIASEPVSGTEPSIRRACVADVPAISRLINESAEYGLMLPRSMSNLYENIRDFHVAQVPSHHEGGQSDRSPSWPGIEADSPNDTTVVGVCALSVVWANLAELASLVVSWDQRGRGLGKRLAGQSIEEARQLGISKVMTLTYEQRFFEALGFSVIDRANLPHKVWSECVRCPKNEACDETAMIRVFDDIADQHVPEPPVSNAYDVPVVLTRTAAGPRHSD